MSFHQGSKIELLELTGIDDHAVDLVENKQTLFGSNYSLEPVELETLKTYIKIWPMELSGLPYGNPILFLSKKVGSLWLCVNSRDPNNLTIKEPMLIAFEPMPIALEAANLRIAWAVSGVVFYPVGFNRRILSEEHLWRQQIENSLWDT